MGRKGKERSASLITVVEQMILHGFFNLPSCVWKLTVCAPKDATITPVDSHAFLPFESDSAQRIPMVFLYLSKKNTKTNLT